MLGNDSDPDGDPISVSGVTQPPNGTVVINGSGPNNTVTYTSKTSFVGTDTFNYTVSDGKGGTASARVTVTVSAPPNRPPVARDDTATTTKNKSVTIAVLANDSDPDGDPLTITSVTVPAHGSVSTSATSVTYTPNPGFLGTDSFQYSISDGRGGTASARVTVTVTEAPNHPPKAMNDTASTVKNTPVTINVVANDSDPDGDALTVTSVTSPSNGTAVNNGNGTVTYTPNSNYTGPDAFNYTISDGRGGTATARVSVTVRASSPAPGTEVEGEGSISDGANGSNEFEFEAEFENGKAEGEIEYESDRAGIDLKGTVEVLQISGRTADFSGPCTLGEKAKTPCRYAVHVEDHGKPGQGVDRFRIRVYNAQGTLIHQADGLLLGGDIRFGND